MIRALFLALAVLAAPAYGQSDYPSKPIRIVVPFPPGGAVDIVGRTIGRGLADAWKASVVIDNRPGASAMIGTEFVAKAPADGYTLLMGSMSALAVNSSLFKSTIRYDPIRDFAPVALVAHTPGVLAVNPKLGVTSVAELVALAKSKPGVLTYASSGNGNFQHLIGEMFKNATGTNIVHVPYKGSAPALVDAIGGQVDMIFDVVPTAAPPIKAGQLRGLGVTSTSRSEALPEVPTMVEAGLTGFNVSSWYGIAAPAGTPADIVAKLNAEIVKFVRSAEARAQLLTLGAMPLGGSAAEFGAHIKSENVRWAEVIRRNGVVAN